MADSPELTAELRAIRAEISDSFTAVNKRLAKIERTTKRTEQAVERVEDAVSWQALINDAIFCGVCLVLVVVAKSADFVKSDVCPQIPGFLAHAVPFNFCGNGGSGNAAQPTEGAQVKAFLDAIAWAEGTGGAAGYSVQFTGSTFASTADHPRAVKCSGDLCSDAAGRYQFLSTTWDGYAQRLGLSDFSPESQDAAAVAILKENGVPALLAAGKVEDAFCKVGGVWASMPCNDYGQPQKSAAELKARYEESLKKYASSAIAPASGGWINPVPSAEFTSGFGYRVSPIQGFSMCHRGIDLAAAQGTPVHAAKSGVVKFAGWDDSGFGNLVILQHPDGTKSLYGHNFELKVTTGQTVEQGQVIALMGSTGNSTGPHTHLEIDMGQGVVDPRPLIPGIHGGQTFGSIDPQLSKQCEGKKL